MKVLHLQLMQVACVEQIVNEGRTAYGVLIQVLAYLLQLKLRLKI